MNFDNGYLEKTITVSFDKDEVVAILKAYDYGIRRVDGDIAEKLDEVINKLKNEIHP